MKALRERLIIRVSNQAGWIGLRPFLLVKQVGVGLDRSINKLDVVSLLLSSSENLSNYALNTRSNYYMEVVIKICKVLRVNQHGSVTKISCHNMGC